MDSHSTGMETTMNHIYVRLASGTVWEFRGTTPGGMVRLWAVGGGASLTASPSDVRGIGHAAPVAS